MMQNMLNKLLVLFACLIFIGVADAAKASNKSAKPKQIVKTPAVDKIKSLIPKARIETTAEYVLLADYHSGQVLYEKNADAKLYPASLTKIVTAMIAFDALENGRVRPETKFHISEAAWRLGGSKMFIEVDSYVSFINLVRGCVVQSGNDASLAIAEGLSGTEEGFVKEMNQASRKLGAKSSNFVNSHGLPHKNHYTTARDLWLISKHVIGSKYYSMFKEDSFTFSKIKQRNRNPLLGTGVGCDGLKTGHTKESGYSLVASAEKNGQRLVLVISGCDSAKAREKESLKFIKWGFNSFGHYHLLMKGDLVISAPVWMGDKDIVPVVIGADVAVVLPRSQRKKMKVIAHYNRFTRAPIKQGQKIGYLEVIAPSLPKNLKYPLLAGTNIKAAGFLKRLKTSVYQLTVGKLEDMVDELEDTMQIEKLAKQMPAK